MTWLALGLALFLGIHLTRAFTPRWREAQIARMGALGWKGFYTVVSLIGFLLILWGFQQARLQPVEAIAHLTGSRFPLLTQPPERIPLGLTAEGGHHLLGAATAHPLDHRQTDWQDVLHQGQTQGIQGFSSHGRGSAVRCPQSDPRRSLREPVAECRVPRSAVRSRAGCPATNRCPRPAPTAP